MIENIKLFFENLTITKLVFYFLLFGFITVIVKLDKKYCFEWYHMVSNDKKTISKGNVIFWIIFTIQLYYWLVMPQQQVEGLFETFALVLAYMLGTKINTTAKTYVNKKIDSTKKTEENLVDDIKNL